MQYVYARVDKCYIKIEYSGNEMFLGHVLESLLIELSKLEKVISAKCLNEDFSFANFSNEF